MEIQHIQEDRADTVVLCLSLEYPYERVDWSGTSEER